jgi:glycosyltransferase involved in cell wall biosynthesis
MTGSPNFGPTLSIITICRNAVLTISSTIESVIGQKITGVEYIVVDGASTDGTMAVVRGFGEAIDLIISEPDQGIYDAINKGIRASHGTYVGLIHAGDRLLPGVISKLLVVLEETPDSIVYGAIRTSVNGRFSGCYGFPAEELPQRMIAHPGAFVARSIYDRHGLYDTTYKIAGDYKAFLSYFLSGVRFVWTDLIIADFALGGVSSSAESTSAETARARVECGYPAVAKRSRWAELRHRIGVLKDAIVGIFS